jgi:hypothetical protein
MNTNTKSTKETVKKDVVSKVIKSTAEAEVKAEDIVVEKKDKPVQKQIKKALKLEKNMLVEVKNNTSGRLIVPSTRDGVPYIFNDYGDFDDIELGDLQMIKRSHPRFFNDQWILVEDPDVIDYLRLRESYKDILSQEEVEGFFELDIEEMESLIEKTSAQNKSLLIGIARQKYSSGEFENHRKIQMLEEKFNITFE